MTFSLVRYQSRGILIPQCKWDSSSLAMKLWVAQFPFFFGLAKRRSVYCWRAKRLYRNITGSGIMLQSHGTKNVKPSWKILLAPSHPPRLSFLIPSDGFLINLAGHIGSFINSMLRIFNLMIMVRYSVTAWNLLRYKGPRVHSFFYLLFNLARKEEWNFLWSGQNRRILNVNALGSNSRPSHI